MSLEEQTRLVQEAQAKIVRLRMYSSNENRALANKAIDALNRLHTKLMRDRGFNV